MYFLVFFGVKSSHTKSQGLPVTRHRLSFEKVNLHNTLVTWAWDSSVLITLSVHVDAHETSVTSLLKSQTQAHRDNNYMSTYDKELQLQNMQNLPFIEDGLSSCTFKNTGPTHRIKQTITCASKSLIYMHDSVLKMPKHPLLTSRIYRTDETRITRQIWRTLKSYTSIQHNCRRSSEAFPGGYLG